MNGSSADHGRRLVLSRQSDGHFTPHMLCLTALIISRGFNHSAAMRLSPSEQPAYFDLRRFP